MTKNKFFAILMSIVMAFALAGCDKDSGGGKLPGPDTNPPVHEGLHLTASVKGAPDYSEHEGELMPIGAWNSSPSINYVYTEKELSAASEAGIQFLCDVRISRYTDTSSGRKALVAAMDAIEKSGMKTFVNLSGLSYTDVKNTELVYSELLPYMEKDFFLGFNFWDEPSVDRFESLEVSAAAYAKDYPDKTGYVNLLPNYATNGQLGVGKDGTYKGYVNGFAQTVSSVDMLSYDFYPLAGQTDNGTVLSHGLNGNWLASLEAMSGAAKSAGKDFWVFIQCMDFNNTNRAPQSVADITFQNYVNMCYGARGLQYFSLTTPPDGKEQFGPAMLDRELNKTANYYYVKEANAQIQSFAHAYLQFTWDNVMPVYGTVINDISATGFDLLSDCMTESEDFEVTSNLDALVGQFHDQNGYKGYMVTRVSDPMDGLTGTLSMTFNASHALVYEGGECKTVEIPSGVYKFSLEAGEGKFIIPYNA